MGKPHLQFHQSKRFVSVSVELIENGTLFKLRYSSNGCEMDHRFTTEIVTRDHAWLMTDTFGITPKFSWLRLRFRGGAEMIMCPYMLPYQYGNSHYIETLRRGSRHCIPCMSKVTINYPAPILSFVNIDYFRNDKKSISFGSNQPALKQCNSRNWFMLRE